MGRFSKVWPEYVRDAITAAMLDQGMSARVAVAKALEGELELQGVPIKVPMPADNPDHETVVRRLTAMAYDWTKNERAERRGEKVPDWIKTTPTQDVAEQLAQRMLTMAAAAITREERRAIGKRDHDRIVSAGKIVREAQAVAKGRTPNRSEGAARPSRTPAPDHPERPATDLLRRARAHRAGTSSDTHPQSDNSDAEANSHAHDTQAEQETKGILTRTDEQAGRAAAAAELGIGDAEQS